MKKIWSLIMAKWESLKGKTVAAKILTLLGMFMNWAYAAEASVLSIGIFMGLFTRHDVLAWLISIWGIVLMVFAFYRKKN